MRKLLAVAALLAVGATSFAAQTKEVKQEKGYTSVALPIGVTGTVVMPEKLMLEVHATKSAGVNGDRFDFDFGNLVLGSTVQSLEGKFEARLLAPDGATTKEVRFAAAPVYSLIDKTTSYDPTSQTTGDENEYANPNAEGTSTITGTDVGAGTVITYSLPQTEGMAGELVNRGTLKVKADATNATETGTFDETKYDLRVIIKNQDAGTASDAPKVLP